MNDQPTHFPLSYLHNDDALDSIPPPPSSETMAVWAPSPDDYDDTPDHVHYP